MAEDRTEERKEPGWQVTGSVHAGPTMVQVGVDRIGHVTLSTSVSATGLGAAASARGALPPPVARELRGLLGEALGEGPDFGKAEGPLRALVAALRSRRPLCFTGNVLVAFPEGTDAGDLASEQAEMVCDADDLAAIEALFMPAEAGG